MKTKELTMRVPTAAEGANGQSVSVSTSSAATSSAVGATTAILYSTVECFVVRATSPTATVATGAVLPATTLVRVTGLNTTDKLAFITATGTGTAYVRPE